MDNLQKHGICINVQSSQTFRSYQQQDSPENHWPGLDNSLAFSSLQDNE
jgi:hypothetical protein